MPTVNCPFCKAESKEVVCSSSTNFQEYELNCGSSFYEAIDSEYNQDFGVSKKCNSTKIASSQFFGNTLSEIKKFYLSTNPPIRQSDFLEQSEQIFEE